MILQTAELCRNLEIYPINIECLLLVALCKLEPRSTDSLGTQHCANFESHSNRETFETNAISITSSIHAHSLVNISLPLCFVLVYLIQ